jgi:UDP-3-O-[3-hydroxymyristoyl] glucosamine N-acyltransferase
MKDMLTKLYLKAKTVTGSLSFTADEVSQFIGGKVIGDGKARISGMESKEFAASGDATFAITEEDLEIALRGPASCVITVVKKDKYAKTVILVDDIKKALTIMYNAMLEVMPPAKGTIHPSAVIASTAKLGKDVTVGPNAVIDERVSIGDNTVIGANVHIGSEVKMGRSCRVFSNAVIYRRTEMGDMVIIHSGTVIGADGFGYVPKGDKIYKVPQMGNVIIGDNVEIGANSCIDRGTFTCTEIGSGTKIDNLVQIAHNVKLGKNVLIASQAGVAGSAFVGDNVMMGGQVGVSDHATIGKDVKLAAKSGVSGRVQPGKVFFGYPARDATETKHWYGLMTIFLKYRVEIKRLLRGLPKDGSAAKGEKDPQQGA